ncbi:hypothetical protein QVD17_07400 [Tagetes erecta]|uniref:3'-5' exonuclease domain-containing protein n=1 Tax=Tagetes erecta TaxID=13708 RepID=A0AAD8LFY5_TARER|nr:hypothetical protein QVD17_07400 [Tagetes erecta]
MSSISMFVHQHPNNTHNTYRLQFHEHTIETLVTNSPNYVDAWISQTENILIHHHHHRNRQHPLIVGLDVEWRPNQARNIQNPVATLQLCVENRCMVFQIIHSPSIPNSLVNFLRNDSYAFAGVGIENDVEKLVRDYNLMVAKTIDLRTLAANVYGVWELRNVGLKALSSRVLGKEVNKAKSVTMSKWDDHCLSPLQVEYASIDAFLSFEIGRVLISGNRF